MRIRRIRGGIDGTAAIASIVGCLSGLKTGDVKRFFHA